MSFFNPLIIDLNPNSLREARMPNQRRRVRADLADHILKPRFIDGQELPNWRDGPEMTDYIKQLAREGWQLVVRGSGHEFIFERQVP
jgi:hypothetical protein